VSELLDQARQRGWYHSIELTPDYTTDGWFDLRPYVRHYGLPERMDGMRALDVGTWDGFWAFEMERRGAEVVALDVDDQRALDFPPRRRPEAYAAEPRGAGFVLAHSILSSKVERVDLSVYNATPERLGKFDLVFCGSVLIHLRDQLLALERMAGLCDGSFICAEEYDRASSLVPFAVARYRADRDKDVVFWQPSVRTWKRMIWTAGFDAVAEAARFKMRSRTGFTVRHVVFRAEKRR
jgi:tRNA (mo5U34)-methyltransferase